jgi:phage tail sheath protein FI
MSEHFLHGVEVIELDGGARPIQTVASAVIGLVGTAPTGPVNKPTLILGSKSEAVKIFGEHADGYTIPRALNAIFDQAGAMVVVINVADTTNSTYKTSMSGQELYFNDNGEIHLGKCNVSNLSLSDGDSDYEEGTDYNYDSVRGIITKCPDGGIEENAIVSVSYSYFDPTKITMGNVVGGVNGDGTYHGAECLLASQSECAIQPRILIAPNFTHEKPNGAVNPVAQKLVELAGRLRAVAIADCPNGTKEEAVAYRADFNSPRLFCAYPFVKVYDSITDTTYEEPPSARIAGVICRQDNDAGFWWSPSNQAINGIVGISKPIDWTLGDSVCVANYLNENKIATIIQQDGFRLWGNRTTSTDAKWCFLSVRRTADMINDSLLKAHLWAVDRNITKTYNTEVCESVNNYLRYLKNIGAIIGGSCWADATLNTPDQIAQGKITFDFDFTAPYPAEHITFRSRLVNDYLTEIFE